LCLNTVKAFGIIVGFGSFKITFVNTLRDTRIDTILILGVRTGIYLIKPIMHPHRLLFRIPYLLATKNLPESVIWIH